MTVGVCLLILAVLAVGDRLLLRTVEHRLADRIACTGQLGDTVYVRIGGFPFLARVATGHIPSMRVTADRGGLDGRLTDISMTVRDLRLPPIGDLLRGNRKTDLTIGSATLAATIPYGARRSPTRVAAGTPTGPAIVSTAAVDGNGSRLPFEAHLDSLTRRPDGIRVQLSVSGAAFNAQVAARSCGGSQA